MCLWQVSFANILSHSVSCLFTFSIVPFDAVFNLNELQCICFVFGCFVLLLVYLTKHRLTQRFTRFPFGISAHNFLGL